MTVCKYLNLHRGTRGDDEERREIGGVSSRHLFHQAFSNEVQLPDSVRVIGECAIMPADTPCMNTFLPPHTLPAVQSPKRQSDGCRAEKLMRYAGFKIRNTEMKQSNKGKPALEKKESSFNLYNDIM